MPKHATLDETGKVPAVQLPPMKLVELAQ